MSAMTSTHPFDESCEICNPASDEPFPDDEADLDGLYVNFVFDHRTRRLVCVHTGGLWAAGLPELYIGPPQDFSAGGALPDAQLAVFLAGGLIELGRRMLAADDDEIPPGHSTLGDRRVQFWLGDQERPFRQLAVNLGPDVDTVIRVDCSLWHSPLLGDG